MELLEIVSKMYGNCGKGPGRFTRTALHNLLKNMTGASIDECVNIFSEIDCDRLGFITLGKRQRADAISTDIQSIAMA